MGQRKGPVEDMVAIAEKAASPSLRLRLRIFAAGMILLSSFLTILAAYFIWTRLGRPLTAIVLLTKLIYFGYLFRDFLKIFYLDPATSSWQSLYNKIQLCFSISAVSDVVILVILGV